MMTTLQRRQMEFEVLNSSYMLLRNSGASNSLLLEMLDHVNNYHLAYTEALRQALQDAVAGKEVSA